MRILVLVACTLFLRHPVRQCIYLEIHTDTNINISHGDVYTDLQNYCILHEYIGKFNKLAIVILSTSIFLNQNMHKCNVNLMTGFDK